MKQLHIYSSIIALTALTTACQSPALDEPQTETAATGRIEIMGGAPSGLPLSRVAEPSQLGYCNADQLRIWVYESGSTLTTVKPSVNNFSLPDTQHPIDIINYCGDYNTDRWTYYKYEITLPAARNVGYLIQALAYKKGDYDQIQFNTNIPGITYTEHTLFIKTNKTPELFFGNLKFSGSINEQANGGFYLTNSAISSKTITKDIEGKIYRLVSQLNLNIDEVNPKLVEKMELYLSNVPSSVILYGNHGAYYPVTATDEVKTDSDGQYLLIDSADDFADGKATLSTFLLPSTAGRRIKVKVYYTKEAFPKEAAKVVKEYDITPGQSAYLSGDNAKVYGSDTPLYIYNSVEDLFYSYANVRVNLKGKFENFFAEKTNTDIALEVCPTFETSHNIPIIE